MAAGMGGKGEGRRRQGNPAQEQVQRTAGAAGEAGGRWPSPQVAA